MTTCNAVKEELVAYRDGELPEQDRERVAAHLLTCAECAREEAQLAQVEYLFSKMERITPSPDFAQLWKRLEQEQALVPVAEPTNLPCLSPIGAVVERAARDVYVLADCPHARGHGKRTCVV
jgi:anti-sigma factor RsiW